MNVIDAAGSVVRQVTPPALFDRDAGEHLDVLFRAVHREFANPRAGTASTCKRDEVAGGGRKPWRQKGTGRARQGSIRSPQWRHGGVVFGPQPRSYVERLNKKERRLAFVAALADRFHHDAITLFETGDFAIGKTAEFARVLYGSTKAAKRGPTTLIVCRPDEAHANEIARVSRNLRQTAITNDCALDVKDLLRFERIYFTTAAYDALMQRLDPDGAIGVPRGDSEHQGVARSATPIQAESADGRP
jgi:large subunit ribosomal protein L4